MLEIEPTPLVRLCSLFSQEVYAKCEFLSASGCFKIRGAAYLLDRIERRGGTRHLVVPSMGNTALGAATAAKALGFTMTGVVPQSISSDKESKLRALEVELMKLNAGGSELLQTAKQIAAERNGYFVHPHLDPDWTDGYAAIADEILATLPTCGAIVFPLGGGGLLLGLLKQVRDAGSAVRLIACEPRSYAKYAPGDHERTTTIADGLRLEKPHLVVQQAIADADLTVGLVSETAIRAAMRDVYREHGLFIEPSAAVPLAYVQEHVTRLQKPICVILTGSNITRDDHQRLMAEE
jgi:threonine dehydratase